MKKMLINSLAVASCLLFFACNNSADKNGKSADSKKTTEKKQADHTGTDGFSLTAPDGWVKKDTMMSGTKLTTVTSPMESAGDNLRRT
jgi:hypothetical protein